MSGITLKVKQSTVLGTGKIFELKPGENSIGRNEPDNNIAIADSGISRKHCLITVDEKTGVFIEDLKSGNGTLVGGRKINARIQLKSRDIIKISDTSFEIVIPLKKTEKKIEVTVPIAPKPQKSGMNTGSNRFVSYIINAAIVFAVILILIFAGKYILKKKSSGGIPGPEDCQQVYMMADAGCKFMYPEGWIRLDRYEKQVFGISYFDRKVLFFGTQYKGSDVMFAVDILEGVPPVLSAEFLTKTGTSEFPRLVPHAGKDQKDFETLQKAAIGQKESYFGISPIFKNISTNEDIKSIEAYIKDADRRILIIGFTDPGLFNLFLPVLKQMIFSFTIEPRTINLPKPSDLRAEVKQLVQNADALLEKVSLKPDNLFNALKNYRKATLLLNMYDFKLDDETRLSLLSKFKKTQKIFDDKYDELKFQIERGVKIDEEETVFKAALEIVKMIPDPNDKRYQAADKWYSRLKEKYEAKYSQFKYN